MKATIRTQVHLGAAMAIAAALAVLAPTPSAQAAVQRCGINEVSKDVKYVVCGYPDGSDGPNAIRVSGSYAGIPAQPRLILSINGVPGPSRKAEKKYSNWSTTFGSYPPGTRIEVCLYDVPFGDGTCSPETTIP